MDLRDKVDSLIKIQGKQKRDLAKYLSISQGNLNRTLSGTSFEKENLIADFFGITRNELIINDIQDKSDSHLLAIIESQQRTDRKSVV